VPKKKEKAAPRHFAKRPKRGGGKKKGRKITILSNGSGREKEGGDSQEKGRGEKLRHYLSLRRRSGEKKRRHVGCDHSVLEGKKVFSSKSSSDRKGGNRYFHREEGEGIELELYFLPYTIASFCKEKKKKKKIVLRIA